MVRTVALVSIGLGLLSHSAPASVRGDYERALGEVNAALQTADAERSCPGVGLAVTCGDGVCDAKAGENEKTCPVDCVPPLVKSYNNQTLCRGVSRVFQPATIEEVQTIVREAAQRGDKLRVIGRMHTANEQLCTVGTIISTERLNHVLSLDANAPDGRGTVLTEAGVTLFELGEWLNARNKSIGYALIGYRDVTVAGAAATGSHGSSLHHSNIIASAVEAVTLVTADGSLHEYSAATTDEATWKTVRTNLGFAGVVVRLRLRVEPQFNLDVKVTFENDKRLFAKGGAMSLVEDCDYGLINWFPGTGRFMRSCGKRTTAKADADANNTLLDPLIPGFIVSPFKKVLQYSACSPTISCLIEKVRYYYFKLVPPFSETDEFGDTVFVDRLVGPSHRMMTSVLSKYQKGLTQMDWELAIPMQHAQAALEAVRDMARRQNLCLPLVGVFLRFAPSEDATWLAHTVAQGEFHKGEPVLFIEMPVYLPHGFTDERRAEHDRPYEEFARMLIEKFGARPHWAKNRDWVFALALGHDAYGPNFDIFKQTISKLDPQGMFMNDWGRKLGFGR